MAEAILADPHAWGDLLRPAGLFATAVWGDASCFGDPRPPSVHEFLGHIDRSRVDGGSRSQPAILPVPEVPEVASPP